MSRRLPLTGLITALAVLFIVASSVAAIGVLQAIPGAALTGTPAFAAAPAFAADVEAHIRSADPARGAALYTQYGCISCHGIKDGVGPYVVGTGERAATRRAPTYSAAAYLYESITAPNAYVVPDYPMGVMPQNFKDRIPADQLYDLIAWLLTQ